MVIRFPFYRSNYLPLPSAYHYLFAFLFYLLHFLHYILNFCCVVVIIDTKPFAYRSLHLVLFHFTASLHPFTWEFLFSSRWIYCFVLFTYNHCSRWYRTIILTHFCDYYPFFSLSLSLRQTASGNDRIICVPEMFAINSGLASDNIYFHCRFILRLENTLLMNRCLWWTVRNR